MLILYIAVGILAGTPLLSWIAYLLFCLWLVRNTKDPTSLQYASMAANAFPSFALASVAQASVKMSAILRRLVMVQ